ncbi:hypothetical protein EDD11_003135 [Mortierella claussenii]|nr:hypothetical protein EDD11_003135 [Mortierella claussenii]
MLQGEQERTTSKDGKIVYPTVRRSDVKDILHGKEVADPYRWLEDPESKETEAFVQEQSALADQFMNKFDGKAKFNERLTELFDYERVSAPRKSGDYYYYFRNSGLQAQSVMYQQESLESEPRVFLDPNLFEADGTAALTTYSFTKSGKLLGYGVSKSGSDWTTIHVMDNQGNKLDDIVEWVKFSRIAFTHDDKGFFYTSFEKPAIDKSKLGQETAVNEYKRLYYHRIGTPQSEDTLVYLDLKNATYMPDCLISEDGKYVLMPIGKDCERANKLYLLDLEAAGNNITGNMEFNRLADNFDAEYAYLINKGTTFYFQTNSDAPRSKIVKYDLAKPEEGFVEVVPQVKDVLTDALVVNEDKLILEYIRDVKSVLVIHDLITGKFLHEVNIPVGTVAAVTGRVEDKDFFIQFMSFLTPGIIYRYSFEEDDEAKGLTVFRESKVKNFQSDLFETKQGLKMDGNNPTFLYAYGGFSISIQASYSPALIAFIQHLGGVAAYANIRGGGEYGEDWHKAAIITKKQNCFDDFQYAAKYLIQEKYTQPERLAINGGSNGGLLVNACLNQAPELFGCGVADVGLSDMLRFHKFTIGHAWQSDYGRPDDKEEFEYLLKYSPLHNVQTEKPYPPVALFTSSHDDRVVPLHSYKFVAELQHKAGHLTDKPLVVRIELKAGHGAGKPLTKRLLEITDKFAFISYAVGAKWQD